MKDAEDEIRQYRVYEDRDWFPASIYIDSIPGYIGLAGSNFLILNPQLCKQVFVVFYVTCMAYL